MNIFKMRSRAAALESSRERFSESGIRSGAIALLIYFALPLTVYGSELSQVANNLAAGEWAILNTQNIGPVITASGSQGHIFSYTDEMRWDPGTRQMLFAGGDHADPGSDPKRFVIYHESNNTWERPSQPSFLSGVLSHGGDEMALDDTRSIFYTRERTYSRTIWAYAIANRTWSPLPNNSGIINDNTSTTGLEYIPEMDGLVWAVGANSNGKGAIFILRDGASSWETLATGLDIGTYRIFLEYSPIHKVAIFGGGNKLSRSLYKLDMNGQVTKLGDAPISLGQQIALTTIDPTSGDFLVFQPGVSYIYHVETDTWQQANISLPIFTEGRNLSDVVASPISTYGVVLFICGGAGGSSDHKVYAYKHSPGSGIPPDTVAPAAPSTLGVQ